MCLCRSICLLISQSRMFSSGGQGIQLFRRSRSSREGETAYKSRFGVSDRGRSRQLRQSDSVCGVPVSGMNAFVGFFFIVGYLRLSLCLRFSISISLVAAASGMYAALPSLRGLVRLLWSLLSSFLFFCPVLSLVASTSGMYAALPSLRGLVRLLWSLLSSLPFFCLVLSLVASAIGIDGDVRSLIQPSWPSATSLDFSGLCCHHHFSLGLPVYFCSYTVARVLF